MARRRRSTQSNVNPTRDWVAKVIDENFPSDLALPPYIDRQALKDYMTTGLYTMTVNAAERGEKKLRLDEWDECGSLLMIGDYEITIPRQVLKDLEYSDE